MIGRACPLGFDTQIVKRNGLGSLLKAVVLKGKSTLKSLQRAVDALPGGLDTTLALGLRSLGEDNGNDVAYLKILFVAKAVACAAVSKNRPGHRGDFFGHHRSDGFKSFLAQNRRNLWRGAGAAKYPGR